MQKKDTGLHQVLCPFLLLLSWTNYSDVWPSSFWKTKGTPWAPRNYFVKYSRCFTHKVHEVNCSSWRNQALMLVPTSPHTRPWVNPFNICRHTKLAFAANRDEDARQPRLLRQHKLLYTPIAIQSRNFYPRAEYAMHYMGLHTLHRTQYTSLATLIKSDTLDRLRSQILSCGIQVGFWQCSKGFFLEPRRKVGDNSRLKSLCSPSFLHTLSSWRASPFVCPMNCGRLIQGLVCGDVGTSTKRAWFLQDEKTQHWHELLLT